MVEPTAELADFAATTLGVGSVFLAVGLTFITILIARRRRMELLQGEQSLETRLNELRRMMRESALMVKEVQTEIDARVKLAEQAQADAERAEEIARLNESQRAALANLVRTELETQGRRTLRSSMLVNFLFFIAGGGITVAATYWLSR